MAVIKCKMCGGDIELSPDKTFGTCEYCGSTMTFPKVDDEQRAAAFNRGNHFRRIGEFDKALAVYERIVQENDTDAEAHWCCALCRFGIEYVEDPASYEWLPTCHRVSFDSFLEDVDYLASVEHSDGITRRQYQKDAAKIAEVQRGILATSQNEDPFDVFLCYKESDDSGNRTVDSTLAQDIYYQLTEQGRRVFFARITLEDKAGTEYEPYIFAALNSAKVMIAVGTKPEHFSAIWVKNEWSRFLALMKKDRSKLLIPCYRDMDPYDLPEQLSVLQSYDMGKIGFIQDLIRGVAKVLDADKASAPVKETVVVQSERGNNLTALLKRGYMALEDSEWQKADTFFEQVLNLDAECAEAYLGKVLAEQHCANMDAFVKMQQEIHPQSTALIACSKNTIRIEAAVQKYQIPEYLDEQTIRQQFEGFDFTYQSTVTSLQERLKQEEIYFKSDKLMSRAMHYAKGEFSDRLNAARDAICTAMQKSIDKAKAEDQKSIQRTSSEYTAFLSEAEQALETLCRAATEQRETDYINACKAQESAYSESDFRVVMAQLNKLNNYKDSDSRITACQTRAEQLRRESEAQSARKEKKKKAIRLGCIVFAIIIATIGVILWGQQKSREQAELQRLAEERENQIRENLVGQTLSFSITDDCPGEAYTEDWSLSIKFTDSENCYLAGSFCTNYTTTSGPLAGVKDNRSYSESASYSITFDEDTANMYITTTETRWQRKFTCTLYWNENNEPTKLNCDYTRLVN